MLNDFLKRRERIIITAVQLLDEKGIKGLTTKEIAKRQNITEPAIYRHFKSKKEIVKAVIDEFSGHDEGIRNTVREGNMGAKEAILFIINTYTTNYENYPELVTSMFSFDVYRYDDELREKMLSIIRKRGMFIEDLVKRGYETGELKTNLEPEKFAELLVDALVMSIFNWKLGECKINLRETVERKVKFLLACC